MMQSGTLNIARTLAVGGLALAVAGFSVKSRREQAPTPKTHNGRQGDRVNRRWTKCDDSNAMNPNQAVTVLYATVKTTPQGRPYLDLTANDPAVYRALYEAAFATCFLEDVDPGGPAPKGEQQYNQSEDTISDNVLIRLRPARFVHLAHYRADLTRNTGYFVADLLTRLNTRHTGVHDASNNEIVTPAGSSTLLWFGKDDNGQSYAAELDLRSFPNVLPTDSPLFVNVLRLGVPVDGNHNGGKTFKAAFARFQEPMLGLRMQDTTRDIPDGTWVSCSIGCCIASNMIAMQ